MAAANRNRRGRAQLPPCYHEGFLEKKSIKDKMGRKLWTSLCGDSLFFFNSSKDSVYIEKLELSDLNSVSDDGSRERNLDAAGFTLHMKKEDVRMIAPSLEARELWKGYMLSIAKLSVPVSLNLLPGQIHAMKEVIEKEKTRQRLPSASPPEQNFDPYVCVLPDMPMCFHKVSRVEAEILLERNPNDGNLLLRPAQDLSLSSFSLTTRQEVNGKSIFKHYRVFRRPEGGFVINLDSPINCATLHDVVNSMVEKTGGVLVPFHMEKHYDQVLVYVEKNEENGELSTHCAKPDASSTPPVPPPKPVTKAQRSSSENEYRNIPRGGDYEQDEAASPAPPVQPRVPGDTKTRHLPYQYSMPQETNTSSDCERKALVPPGYGKKPLRSNSLSDMPKNAPKQQIVMDELAKVINSRRPIQE